MSTHTVNVGEVERSGRGEEGEGGRQKRGYTGAHVYTCIKEGPTSPFHLPPLLNIFLILSHPSIPLTSLTSPPFPNPLPYVGQITSKVSHTQHSPHRSLTLCPLHTREHDRKRHWADPKMHSPYSDGQPVHPYQAGAAHTDHAPHVMPPSVGYLHPVKISAYHTNVPYMYNPTPVVH